MGSHITVEQIYRLKFLASHMPIGAVTLCLGCIFGNRFQVETTQLHRLGIEHRQMSQFSGFNVADLFMDPAADHIYFTLERCKCRFLSAFVRDVVEFDSGGSFQQ